MRSFTVGVLFLSFLGLWSDCSASTILENVIQDHSKKDLLTLFSHEDSMSYEITIYTTKTCPYCIRAKELLKRKGVEKFVQEIDVTDNPELRVLMTKRANGRKTVPQIFIGDNHIGGFDDLNALDQLGELDKLLEKLLKENRVNL